MKLAEALQERADLNRQAEQIRSRLTQNAVMQEGVPPAEDPEELIKLLDKCISRLYELISKINLTNSRTYIGELTLTELIARKDTLTIKLAAYRQLADAAGNITQRYSQSEIRRLSTVNVKNLRAECDELAKELRFTENQIQKANWETELIDN